MTEQTGLRLLAYSEEDLEVISAAVQDAVVKAGNLKYESRKRRFGLEVNRFRWEKGVKTKERIRSLLAFDGVLSVKALGVNKRDPEMILSLLSITYAKDAEPPGGTVTLLFAGDGEIAIEVEALDVSLLDSDYTWNTKHVPSHDQRRR